ncbi:metal ABC transporter permease [candidate division KSB1 bacterium]|nr:metal ABC transporter permease [candidate division KSB1 bacterium]
MNSAIEFMIAPFFATMLLIGINVYFGIHVIKREIIFIDIALAQLAALGATVASVFFEHAHNHGHEGTTLEEYIFSVAFTILAAYIFTLFKSRKLPIPLEALIGIGYAIAATGSVILLDTAAGGEVHVKEMVEGAILWVSWGKIIELAIVFGLIGLLHFIYRRKFLALTDDYSKTQPIKHAMLWDFLFYASFGIAVVHSVSVGGILTIFAFLILPASISALFMKSWQSRIFLGWGLGTIVTVCGLYLSWNLDVPSAPTIILVLGVCLLLSLIVKKVLPSSAS